MIRAIVFDCFGVLTSDGWLPFKRKHFSHDEALLRWATDLNKRVDAGLMSYDDFIMEMSRASTVPGDEVRKAIVGHAVNEELFSYIAKQLKPRYKIGLLSNVGEDWLDDLFGKEYVSIFDATALSYETGILKPSEQAYRIIAERLGVGLEECVFVDDQERNCTAAKDFGMQAAVIYSDFDQFKHDIETLLGDLEN